MSSEKTRFKQQWRKQRPTGSETEKTPIYGLPVVVKWSGAISRSKLSLRNGANQAVAPNVYTVLIYHFLSPSCSPTPFTTFTTMTTTMTSQVNQHFKCKIKIKATNYLSILSPCRPDPPREFRSCLRRVWRGPGLDGASPNLGGLRHLRGQQSILATLSAAWKEVEVLWEPFGGTRRWRFR